jgi:hypothetical protein
MRSITVSSIFLTVYLALFPSFSAAFSATTTTGAGGKSNKAAFVSKSALFGATTVEPPTREKTDRDVDTGGESYTDEDEDLPDLEYLIDQDVSREMEDPFHILLLGSTFEKPKITLNYVSGALEYVLAMPTLEAKELSQFAKEEGMSCLGTWPREECLSYGKQLQRRDLVCRVVPYCEGGQRGWQAKDAGSSSSNNANSFA